MTYWSPLKNLPNWATIIDNVHGMDVLVPTEQPSQLGYNLSLSSYNDLTSYTPTDQTWVRISLLQLTIVRQSLVSLDTAMVWRGWTYDLLVDIPSTLGISHVEAENERAKRQPWILGFKATRCRKAYIQNIRQQKLPRLRAFGLQ